MVSGIGLLLLIAASIVMIVLLTAFLKWHPVLSLLTACFFLGLSVGLPLVETIRSIEEGFGSLMRYIGLIVVFGSVIGVYLEKSGGALRIAQAILLLTGKGRSIRAISLIGAVVSVPVFCDSGFILLSGLTRKVSQLSGTSRAGLSLALASGLYTTHTLIPPTPGPIAAAGNIGASDYLGTIMLMGALISIPVLLLTQFMAGKMGEKIVLTEGDEIVLEETTLPGLSRSLGPLLLPILMIAAGTVGKFIGYFPTWLEFLGNPMVAIFAGAILAIVTLGPGSGKTSLLWFESAIRIAGPILIITATGGAFGSILKATPLADDVASWLSEGQSSEILVLILVFLIAAVLKTAQGSSTSAMVIASSLLAPLVPILGWDSPLDLALAVMAIGGGAMTVSHFNDSYFWVVSQFSGMDARDTNRSFTILTAIQGITVLALVLLIALLF